MTELNYYKTLCELQNDVISAITYNKLSDSEENHKWVIDSIENLKQFHEDNPAPNSSKMEDLYNGVYFDDRSATFKSSNEDPFPEIKYNPVTFKPEKWNAFPENSIEDKSLKAFDKLMAEQPELVEEIMDRISQMDIDGPTVEEYFQKNNFKK